MSPSMGLLPLLSSLGSALAEFGHYNVGLVDPVLSWPCWDGESASNLGAAGQFRGRWIAGPQVAAVGPEEPPERGSLAQTVRSLLEYARPRCEYVLVDTSGLMATGEDLTALVYMDAAFLVAEANRTGERELLARHAELPDHKRLGVVLTSPR